MSLQIKQGDLFANLKETPCLIVHGCNAQGKMNAGFAKELRRRFPDAYDVYKTAERAHGLKVGDINGFTTVDEKYTIVNAITQHTYGRDKTKVYVSYEGVEKALGTVSRWVLNHGGDSDYPIHLPLIGGGLANGDKDTLIAIFERVFINNNATLWLQERN